MLNQFIFEQPRCYNTEPSLVPKCYSTISSFSALTIDDQIKVKPCRQLKSGFDEENAPMLANSVVSPFVYTMNIWNVNTHSDDSPAFKVPVAPPPVARSGVEPTVAPVENAHLNSTPADSGLSELIACALPKPKVEGQQRAMNFRGRSLAVAVTKPMLRRPSDEPASVVSLQFVLN